MLAQLPLSPKRLHVLRHSPNQHKSIVCHAVFFQAREVFFCKHYPDTKHNCISESSLADFVHLLCCIKSQNWKYILKELGLIILLVYRHCVDFKKAQRDQLLAITRQVRAEPIVAHRSDLQFWISAMIISVCHINPMAGFVQESHRDILHIQWCCL